MGTTRHYWPMCGLFPVGASAGSIALSSSTSAIGSIFSASATGSIDRVHVFCSAILSPPVYSVNIETVSAGVPTGTLVTAGATQTFTPVANTSHVLTLGTAASVTRGQLYAVTVRYSSGTIGASNRGTFRHTASGYTSSGGQFDYPSVKTTTDGTSWTAGSSVSSVVCPVYTDGSHEIGSCSYVSNSNISFGTSNITDFGSRFTAPLSGSCVGAVIGLGAASASAPRTLRLLDTSNNVLASVSQSATSTSSIMAFLLFSTPYSIADGTDYRLVLTATTSTTQTVIRNVCNSAAGNSSLHGNCYHTQRSGGTWTDSTEIAPLVVPLFASPTSSSSSGSPTVSYYVG